MVEIYQSRLVSDLLASITYQIMERHNIKNAKKAYSIDCTNIGGTVQPFHDSKRETHGIWVEHQNASEGCSTSERSYQAYVELIIENMVTINEPHYAA